MKKYGFCLFLLSIVSIVSFAQTSNTQQIDVTGTWSGSIQGNVINVNITNTGWTSSIPAINNTDTGTFQRDGNVARLTSRKNGKVIGLMEISDRNTIRLTLNENSIAPGNYTLKRQINNVQQIDVTGNWTGSIHGNVINVRITSIGWASSIPALSNTDTGTYQRDDNTARLFSDNNGKIIGYIEVTDRNTMILSLNENSIAPGIYTLKKQ